MEQFKRIKRGRGVSLFLLVGLISLATAGCNDRQQQSNLDSTQKLISHEQDLNEKCKNGSGDNPKTIDYCRQRDQLVIQLNAQGWCWGSPEQAEYQKSWRRCAGNPTIVSDESPEAKPGNLQERSFQAPTRESYEVAQKSLRQNIWQQNRQNYMQTVQNITWALTCNAIDESTSKIIIGSQQVQVLSAHGSIDPNFKNDEHNAVVEGRAKAKIQGCLTWLQHPEIVASLRALAYSQ